MDYGDWVFGISDDGRLLTHNGGNIYPNTGDLMVDEPGSPYYGGEVDICRFDRKQYEQTETEQYRGWNLRDIYAGKEGFGRKINDSEISMAPGKKKSPESTESGLRQHCLCIPAEIRRQRQAGKNQTMPGV